MTAGANEATFFTFHLSQSRSTSGLNRQKQITGTQANHLNYSQPRVNHERKESDAQMKFIASDGTSFTDRALYRKYEMETQYTFRDKQSATLVKQPGSILGQPFVIDNCQSSEILLLDYCDQVQIDDVRDSKVFIGASSGSVFVRNCKNCTFTVACGQLRTRDCGNVTFNLYCKTEPVIETSTDMRFGPFNGAYPGHEKDMLLADLDPSINKWQSVYDFNDPSETGENWRLLEPEEQDNLWCPLGKADCCIRKLDVVSVSEEEGYSADKYECIGDIKEATKPTTDGNEDESTGPFHQIKVFGCRAWTIISQTVCSVQAFCLGLIFSGLQLPNKMISSGRSEYNKRENVGFKLVQLSVAV